MKKLLLCIFGMFMSVDATPDKETTFEKNGRQVSLFEIAEAAGAHKKIMLPSENVIDQRLFEQFGEIGGEVTLGQILGGQTISPYDTFFVVKKYLMSSMSDSEAYAKDPKTFCFNHAVAHSNFLQHEAIVRCVLQDTPNAITALEDAGMLAVYKQNLKKILALGASIYNNSLEAETF